MEIKIKHVSKELSVNKVLLETTLTQDGEVKTIYEAVLTVDYSIGDNFVGYAIDGYNHISEKDISVVNVVTIEELNVIVGKWNIKF